MMLKALIATLALTLAAPVAGQTTNCRYIVANAPQYGVTCETQQGVQLDQPAPRAPAQLQYRDYGAEQAQSQAMALQRQDMALRERELRLREAQAGIAPPAAPSTGRKIGRALFGF